MRKAQESLFRLRRRSSVRSFRPSHLAPQDKDAIRLDFQTWGYSPSRTRPAESVALGPAASAS